MKVPGLGGLPWPTVISVFVSTLWKGDGQVPLPWGSWEVERSEAGGEVRPGLRGSRTPLQGSGQTQALAVALGVSSGNESPSPSHPPAPCGVPRREAGSPRLSLRLAGEALVADRVGARVRGLLLLRGQVASVRLVGRGGDPQRGLAHLQAEALA